MRHDDDPQATRTTDRDEPAVAAGRRCCAAAAGGAPDGRRCRWPPSDRRRDLRLRLRPRRSHRRSAVTAAAPRRATAPRRPRLGPVDVRPARSGRAARRCQPFGHRVERRDGAGPERSATTVRRTIGVTFSAGCKPRSSSSSTRSRFASAGSVLKSSATSTMPVSSAWWVSGPPASSGTTSANSSAVDVLQAVEAQRPRRALRWTTEGELPARPPARSLRRASRSARRSRA